MVRLIMYEVCAVSEYMSVTQSSRLLFLGRNTNTHTLSLSLLHKHRGISSVRGHVYEGRCNA